MVKRGEHNRNKKLQLRKFYEGMKSGVMLQKLFFASSTNALLFFITVKKTLLFL